MLKHLGYKTLEQIYESKQTLICRALAEADLKRCRDEFLKAGTVGDYFLTSLLLNPLARNEVTSKRVDIEVLVEKKNSLNFRSGKMNWEAISALPTV